MKKKLLVVLILFIIVLMFLVGYFIINQKDKINLKSDKFNFEYGEKVSSDLKYYLKEDAGSTKNINDFKLEIGDIELDEGYLISSDSKYLNVGTYKLKIIYKKDSKEFSIVVKDRTSPEFIDFKDKITLEQNSIDVDLKTFFKATDLSTATIDIKGEYDITKVGSYNIQVIASDQYDNETIKDVVIEIVDFEAAKKEDNITKNLDGKIYKSEKMVEYETNKDKRANNQQTTSKNSASSNNNSSSAKSNNNSNNSAASSPRYRKDISDSYVSKINAYRSSQGLSVLPVTDEAQSEADRRAKEIVTNPSHDGSSYGFGENIGGGAIGTDFYNLWMNSHAHYNAIIREQNVAIASSVYEINGMWYAVVVFRMNY